MDLRKANTEFMQDVKETIQLQFDSTGLVASGFARNSIKVVANQFLKAEIRGRQYTAYLQTGFKGKPANVSRRFIDNIVQWMQSRGIQPERDGEVVENTAGNIKRSAFGIARGIVKRGTSINQGRRGLDFSEAINSNMTPYLESIGAEFVVSFKDKLKISKK